MRGQSRRDAQRERRVPGRGKAGQAMRPIDELAVHQATLVGELRLRLESTSDIARRYAHGS